MAFQKIKYHAAKCLDCGDKCERGNVQAWAHKHANEILHNVEVSIVYEIGSEQQS